MGEPMNKQEFRAEGSTEQHSTQPAAGIAVLKQVSQAPPTGAHKDKGGRRATHDDLMNDQLMDAEALINYAADVGIPIADDVRRQVLGARQAAVGGWTEDRSIKLLSALTKLSASLKPVSGESLRKCVPEEAGRTIRIYWWAVGLLAAVIVPYSVAAFFATATCDAIRKDIEIANALAVTLTYEVVAPSARQPSNTSKNTPSAGQQYSEKQIKALQQFAATMRAIYDRAMQLKVFGTFASTQEDPYGAIPKDAEARRQLFELPSDLSDLPQVAKDKIYAYQGVRRVAQSVQEAVSMTFGAVTSCILPMLYALLGACAFLVHKFEDEMKTRSFTGMDRPAARILIAGIGGLVVGLFGNFGADHGTSLSPLAIAFLVGYATDVFLSFLNGLLQTFGRSRDVTPDKRTGAQPAGAK